MASYYIATDGNDSNNGSLGSPWATFTHAYSQMSAGDKLLVRGGTYTPTVGEDKIVVDVSGASDAWCETKAYDAGGSPETVIIDGLHTYPSAEQITGLTPAQGNLYGTRYPTNYKGLVNFYCNYHKWTNISIHNSKGRGLEIETIGGGAQWHHITVTGCDVLNARHAGIVVEYADNIEFYNCSIVNAGSYAPYLRPIIKSEADTTGSNNHPGSMKVSDCDGLVIDGLISHDNWGEGLNVSAQTINYIVRNCEIYNVMSPLLYLHRSRQGEIYNNRIYWTPEGAPYGNPNAGIFVQNEQEEPFETMEAGELLIYNNLVVGCKHNVFLGAGYKGQYGFDQVYFYHNTLVNAVEFGVNLSDRAPLTDIKFWNNIIYDNTDTGQLATVGGNPEISCRYNGWSATPTASARGTGDVYGDLKLANPDAAITPGAIDPDNYRKLGTSPAIFAGVAIPDVTVDYYDGVRNDPPDLGFDEFDPTEGGGGGDPGGGSAPVALSLGVAQNVAAASTGTTSLTDTAFGDVTPKAAFIVANKAGSITSGRAAYNTAQMSLGFFDGTTQACLGMRSKDSASTSNTDVRSRGSSNKAVVLLKDGATSAAAELTAAGFITNGVQLSASVAPDGAVNLMAALFGGDDLSAKVNVHSFGSTETSKSVTGLAFQPNVFMAITSNALAADSPYANGLISLGMAKGIDTQYAFEFFSNNNVATSDPRQTIYSNVIASRVNASQTFAISAIAADGYTLTRGGSNGAADVIVLAMYIPGATLALGVQDLPAATGSQTYSLGFETKLAIAISSLLTAIGSGNPAFDSNANGWGVSMWTADAAHAMGYTDEDGQTVPDSEASYANQPLLVRQSTGADAYLASETNMDSPGPTLNFSAALAGVRKMILFGIEKTTDATITPDFAATITSGEAPFVTVFADQSTTENTTITSRQWNFGDGTTSTSNPVFKTFSVPGTYTVTLVVSDGTIAATKVRTNYITVTAPPPTPPSLAQLRAAGATMPEPATSVVLAGAAID